MARAGAADAVEWVGAKRETVRGLSKSGKGSSSLAQTDRSDDGSSVLVLAPAFFEQALEFRVALEASEVWVAGNPVPVVVAGSDGLP